MEKVTINLDQLRDYHSRQASDSEMIVGLVDGAKALTQENNALKTRLGEVQAELDALKAIPKEAPKGE